MAKLLLVVAVFLAACLTAHTLGDGSLKSQVGDMLMKHLAAKARRGISLKDVDGNAYVDEVLADFKAEVDAQGLDPYKFGHISFMGVDFAGYMGGYSNIYRNGDAAVSQTPTSLVIACNLAIYNLETIFNWTFISGDVYNGDADAMVDYVYMAMSMSGNIPAGATEVYLQTDSFSISEIGRITIEVHGFGIFDEIIQVVVQAITNLMSPLIEWVMENVIEVVFNDVLSKFPVPLPEA